MAKFFQLEILVRYSLQTKYMNKGSNVMTFLFTRIVFSLALVLSLSTSSFSSGTSEIFGEVVGFSIGKGIRRDCFVFPVPISLPDDIPTDIKGQIREFVDEKMNEIPPHDFFSVDRFTDAVPHEAQDEQLIENWKVWYFGKYFVGALGGLNARKELRLMLESKKEFYENIAFMTTEPRVGLAAKEFYRKQLDAVGQLPTE